ncbi:MAG: recombinase family protein [Rhodanobacter sp.]
MRDGASIGELARWLTERGVRTRKGKTVWDRSTVWAMLRNPAYRGQAAFGKTKTAERHGGPTRGGVGRRQPGVVEAPAEPAFGRLQQALFGDFLDGGVQRQVQLMGGDIAGNQLEYHVATVLAALAHQHPVILVLPMQGQTHRHAEVGQLEGETLRVCHFYRLAPLQGLGKVERHADALVAQAFGGGFDMQWQSLEVAGVFSYERSRHVGSFLRRGGRVGGIRVDE